MKYLISLFILIIPLDVFSQLKNYEKYLPSSTDNIIGHHSYYSYSFMKEHNLSEWTIYFTTKDMACSEKKAERGRIYGTLFKDPNLKSNIDLGMLLENYRNNPYDKGHLVPAADMNFSMKSLKETFYHTNMAPQMDIVNRGPMRKLESKVCQILNKRDSLVIITGLYFEDPENVKKIKPNISKKNSLSIPSFFYKILIDINENKSIGFVIPNSSDKTYLMSDTISLVHSIKEIEDFTGIDFNHKLSKKEQSDLEKDVSYNDWFDMKEYFGKESLKKSKLALVIGNDNYLDKSLKLSNAINDAELINETFKKLDFDKIILKKDLNEDEMISILKEYLDLQKKYDFSILYFAGHGIQDQFGNPFLIPVDYNNDNKKVELKRFISFLSKESENKNLIILDACRETSNSIISKPLMASPVNLKLAFSTSFNHKAFDNSNQKNSLYTSYLAENFNKKLKISDILQNTWNKVWTKTLGKQSPEQHFGQLINPILIKNNL